MSFDWIEYIYLAKELARISDESQPYSSAEADFRAAISRAYYATYHKALEFLDSKGENDLEEGHSRHEKLINKFRLDPRSHRRLVGDELRRIQRARIRADYYPTYDLSVEKSLSLEKEAEKIIVLAEKLIQKLSTIK